MYDTIGQRGTEFCVLYSDDDPCLHRLPRNPRVPAPPSIGGEYYAVPPRLDGSGSWAKARDGAPFVCGRHAGQLARLDAIKRSATEDTERLAA